jgi:hypothetical protein
LLFQGHNSISFTGFDELFTLIKLDRTPENLEIARGELSLIEGDKTLPNHVGELLIEASKHSKYVLINCWQSPETYFWEAPLASYLTAPELLDVLPHRFGEFAILDEGNNWFLKLRDDDPFLFLCASEHTVSQLQESSGKYVMKVPGSFVYAS